MNSKVKKLAVAALSVSFVTAATFGILPLAAPNAFNGTGTTVVAESATVGTESELQAALNEGGEVILGKDIVITETITITIPDVTVTLDLAGYTVSKEVNEEIVGNNSLIVNHGNLTVTDTSEEKTGKISYNFNGTSTGKFAVTAISNQQGTLTVKGGTIESLSAGTGVYPFTIDNLTNGNGDAVLNVEGGVITAAQGGSSIRGFANSTTNECVINITGGVITGRVLLQDPSDNANKGTLTITGGTISEYTPGLDAVRLHGYGDASGMNVTLGGDVVVNGSTYLMSYNTTKAFIAEITGGTYGGDVWVCTWAGDEYTAIPAISGGTFTMEVAEEYIAEGFELAENEDGTYGVTETVAYLAKIGTSYYASLQEAFEAAQNGDTITLLSDLTLESDLNIAQKGVFNIADGASITLDLGGYTISVTDNSEGNFIVFYNYGEFTIKNGTVNLTATKDRNWGAESAIILNRGGVLNIENGTYTHKGGTDMAFVVDNNGNAFGDATTNILGGELYSTYTAIRNRMDVKKDGNGTGTTYLNISGGTISGTTNAIWAQAASTSTTSPATGVINVSGGTISLINTARSDGAKCMTTISGGSVEAVKCEVGELTVTGGEVGEVTVLSAKDEAVDYVITEDGAYVAYSALGRIGVIRNIATTNEAGEDRYQVVFLCGIDSLNYKAVGFEVTVGGVTKTIETSTVYTGYIAAGEEYAPSAFGATSEYIFAIAINFPTDFASEAVEVRAFYEDKEGNVVYGETKTCDYIYNK